MPLSPKQTALPDATTDGFPQAVNTALTQMPRLAEHVSKNGFNGGIQSYDAAHAEFMQQFVQTLWTAFQSKSAPTTGKV